MRLKRKNDYFQIIFSVGMWWRIIYGIFKLILGIILLNFVHIGIGDLFYQLVGNELLEDPNDFLINLIGLILNKENLSVTYFIVFYFIFWGGLDVFLSVNLLRLKVWAYPVSLFLISFFTMYEIYRFIYTHSLILLSVIFIDIILLFLIKREYYKLKKVTK